MNLLIASSNTTLKMYVCHLMSSRWNQWLYSQVCKPSLMLSALLNQVLKRKCFQDNKIQRLHRRKREHCKLSSKIYRVKNSSVNHHDRSSDYNLLSYHNYAILIQLWILIHCKSICGLGITTYPLEFCVHIISSFHCWLTHRAYSKSGLNYFLVSVPQNTYTLISFKKLPILFERYFYHPDSILNMSIQGVNSNLFSLTPSFFLSPPLHFLTLFPIFGSSPTYQIINCTSSQISFR